MSKLKDKRRISVETLVYMCRIKYEFEIDNNKSQYKTNILKWQKYYIWNPSELKHIHQSSISM